ncbi:hypothetical protein AN639_12390 [Candidatus Epulonipiscium fishelsonii]|uniref:Uncharacterized protein n=1 Tax=Candidatus Epulonipiscium fishelsonii TaxID=77094 RepID=A0ACC8XC65_9FIRM|nr:hypothetical protein AN396_01160 [Epulopiscium sp. SCG-B11WGA-EpuloA1]ONI42452.1 hypothetical protein AN639_12390 [Epulopiscium sp. SCG-B05WGA-EpuloA1]ONI46763.1 hypothetical protein AN644_02605 [Epulopiscium sp. SCG-C06WGA-EpuloA1]
MKISIYIKINKKVKWNNIKKSHIRKGKYPKNLFFLCTSPYNKLTFEIVQGHFLNENYNDSYLLSISKHKDTLVEDLQNLVDLIYNKKQLTLNMLRQEHTND